MNRAMIEEYFALQRERYSILLKRRAGQPWPWTTDPILQHYSFTNTFREDDKTTVWLRENVRERLRDQPECLLACVVYRWFCKPEIGEVIFKMPDLLHESLTPWEVLLRTGSVGAMRHGIRNAYPNGPYVTGAYMLRSPTGMNKLDGMLSLIDGFYHKSNWRDVAMAMLPGSTKLEYHPFFRGPSSMENFTRWLQKFPGMGPFLAYEIACDLQYTDLLCNAPDICTWANLGPGARRGLNRISDRSQEYPEGKVRRKWRAGIKEDVALEEMRILLALSRDPALWPTEWPRWTMREVENALCEASKYWKMKHGEGQPKRLYRHQ